MKVKPFHFATLTLAIAVVLTGCHSPSPDTADKQNPVESRTEATIPTHPELQLLCSSQYPGAISENGYYYLLSQPKTLKDGSDAYLLMYMDFETQQEVYLCSNTGCTHDTKDCAAVFSSDDISYDNRLFLYNDSLFLLTGDSDNSGSIMTGMSTGDDYSVPCSASLYRMNLNGTERELLYQFGNELTIEDSIIIGDDTGIYFITKKLSTETINNSTAYRTTAERKLIRLSAADWTEETVYEFNPSDNLTQWNVCGCFDYFLVLSRTSYEQELSPEDLLDDDLFLEAYEHSLDEFAILDLASHTLNTTYSISNKSFYSYAQRDRMLYISSEEENYIRQIDLLTGENSILTELEHAYIWRCFEDTLLCSDSDSNTPMYFVNRADGSIHVSHLSNKSLGWPLEFRGELADDLLVVYDYDAVPMGNDGSYEIRQYKYALIRKEDLYTDTENYRPIQMIETGE